MQSEEHNRARKKAMDLLARREHSLRELSTKLRSRGFDDAIVEPVLAELTNDGLLDESRFAEAYVRARSRRGFGPARLQAELRQRGLADSIINNSLADPDNDWPEIARNVLSKKFGDGAPSDLKERARQTRFLEYRGFETDLIRAILGS